MIIDKNSYRDLALVFFLSALAIWASFHFIGPTWISWVIAIVLWLFCIFQMFFFRVPERQCPGTGRTVTSVADGKISIVDTAFEKEFLGRECKRVCIYMDFFDVHANFWPVEGEVTDYRYHPGKHFLAFKPKSSEENEHTTTVIRTSAGREILFRQIAGTFARRIVCYSKPGLAVRAGEQCGIIKFGSRIDFYLPMDAQIKVKPGDKVRACESVIAELPED